MPHLNAIGIPFLQGGEDVNGTSNGLGTSFQGTVTLGIDTLINNLIAGLS